MPRGSRRAANARAWRKFQGVVQRSIEPRRAFVVAAPRVGKPGFTARGFRFSAACAPLAKRVLRLVAAFAAGASYAYA
ncbi:hypothetical protein BG61_20165 [Caballeronia glathei]|uniref:Uncharacterized protein n=1 Tax=Caballeronia glathei TaxID=60547 RepID=A0A069PKM6_9BURK|nr:hypothetical protein BG61_20165 [Caballeronia glathei]